MPKRIDYDAIAATHSTKTQDVIPNQESIPEDTPEIKSREPTDVVVTHAQTDEGDSSDRRLPHNIPETPNETGEMATEEMEIGGATTTSEKETRKMSDEMILPRTRPKQKVSENRTTKTTTSAQRVESDTVQIRQFPKALALRARSMFPDASSNTEAITAVVALQIGKDTAGLPESVQDLIASYEGALTLEDVNQRLSLQERTLVDVKKSLSELELLLTYLTFDRLGYRQDNPRDVNSVDFLEHGVSDLMSRAREQAMQLRNRELIKEGRPKR